MGSASRPDGFDCRELKMCSFPCLCLSPLQCPFCFLRKEGLSKCGRCKQAFYCDVECQVGAGPTGREGPVSCENRDPSILLFLVTASPVSSCSQGWKAPLWRRMWLDTPGCWPRTRAVTFGGPRVGLKRGAGGEVGSTGGEPRWARAGVFPRSTVHLQGHRQQMACAQMTEEQC